MHVAFQQVLVSRLLLRRVQELEELSSQLQQQQQAVLGQVPQQQQAQQDATPQDASIPAAAPASQADTAAAGSTEPTAVTAEAAAAARLPAAGGDTASQVSTGCLQHTCLSCATCVAGSGCCDMACACLAGGFADSHPGKADAHVLK